MGLNILPSREKLCSFDCLYCQYGFSPGKNFEKIKKLPLPTVEDILNALQQALQTWGEKISYITFSGNGEATLHPQFPEITRGVVALKRSYALRAKTAILSNSTTVGDPIIRHSLMKLDKRIMKLDAGNNQMLILYNRPTEATNLQKIVDGLSKMAGVTIQSLFTKGRDGNFSKKHLDKWIEQISNISPELVQVYSLDRNSPTKTLVKLTKDELKYIQSRLERENINAAIYP